MPLTSILQTERPENTPSYSHSRLKTFSMCPYKDYLERVMNRRLLGNYYTARGKGLHVSRELNFSHKIKTSLDLPLSDCLDAARDAIKDEINDDNLDLKCEQLKGLGKKGSYARIIDDTIPLVTADHRMLYSLTQPLYVEQGVAVELPDEEFDLYGIIDVITTGFEVGDAKSKARRLTAKTVATDLQWTMYWLLAKVFLGRSNPGGWVDCIIAKQPVLAYRLNWTRTMADVDILIKRFRVMHTMIVTGQFPPCGQDQWNCSPRWCGHWRECPYTRSNNDNANSN